MQVHYTEGYDKAERKEDFMSEKTQKVLINKKEFYRNLTRLAFPIALQSLMLASVAAGMR